MAVNGLRIDVAPCNWHHRYSMGAVGGGTLVVGRTIDEWYLNRGSSSADDRTDDDVMDRSPDTWLDSAAARSGRPSKPSVSKPKPSAARRSKAKTTPTSAVVRNAPKPSVRELESEILAILRSKAQASVRDILHRKGGGWARLTPKEISVAVRRVQPRIKRTPKSPKRALPAPVPALEAVIIPMGEVRRAVIQIHALRPLWATWEISRYLRSKGWSNVSTDLVKRILPPPGMSTLGSAGKRKRPKRKKSRVAPKTRKTPQLAAAPLQVEPGATTPAVIRRTPPNPAMLTAFCPSCGVRISVLGSCRCS